MVLVFLPLQQERAYETQKEFPTVFNVSYDSVEVEIPTGNNRERSLLWLYWCLISRIVVYVFNMKGDEMKVIDSIERRRVSICIPVIQTHSLLLEQLSTHEHASHIFTITPRRGKGWRINGLHRTAPLVLTTTQSTWRCIHTFTRRFWEHVALLCYPRRLCGVQSCSRTLQHEDVRSASPSQVFWLWPFYSNLSQNKNAALILFWKQTQDTPCLFFCLFIFYSILLIGMSF